MPESGQPPLHALPDGEAELAVVLRLTWEDVAAIGQEASRLAARAQRAVTLDEAVSHRLRSRPPASHAKPPQTGATALPVSVANGRAPGEQARQAIDKINGRSGPEAV
ncbi:hypothetical protein OG785_40150 [Streptomyces sp. NBC_00006]|uniref:hypothetical protein n=1 Tax=Streptomyces sp. NBC_00006 TaxID=2975619 RepID=UPI0022544852|nr:hypothetical protein [Streptomyces sp. NBC_00006]MCX5536765.1 hypothetical protein [Streptomyces sp. NBC_00006]